MSTFVQLWQQLLFKRLESCPFVFLDVGRALAHTILGEDAKAQQNVERAVELGYDRVLV